MILRLRSVLACPRRGLSADISSRERNHRPPNQSTIMLESRIAFLSIQLSFGNDIVLAMIESIRNSTVFRLVYCCFSEEFRNVDNFSIFSLVSKLFAVFEFFCEPPNNVTMSHNHYCCYCLDGLDVVSQYL